MSPTLLVVNADDRHKYCAIYGLPSVGHKKAIAITLLN